MNRSLVGKAILIVVCLAAWTSVAQQNVAEPRLAASSAVPRLVNFNGVLTGANGRPASGVTGATFLIYKDAQGGAPLWMETQNITPERNGQYTVTLGATKPGGVPAEIFVSGEARWLAVQIAGQGEEQRVLLVAVPYALKAGDAETIGGLPPSAFMLSPVSAGGAQHAASSEVATSSAPPPASAVTTSGGTVNALPLWTTSTNLQSSAVTQTGTGATAKIGVGTATPAATLDVKGSSTIRGTFTLPATGVATAAAGKTSQSGNLVASSFNSATSTALNQTFQWRAEPSANNTANPSGTLNLLYGLGASVPSETGLRISSKGLFTFANGQTFPGTAVGTVQSVGLTAPASDFTVGGSPVTGSGTLALGWKVPPTSANTANAIVKRDATGSFNVKSITGTGTFSTSTTKATGIAGSTSFDGGFGVHGSAASVSGTQINVGVLGDSISPGRLSSGVIGRDLNTSARLTVGVQGSSANAVGIGVLGFNGSGGLTKNFTALAGFQRIGVWGDADNASTGLAAIGVMGTSDTGVGVFASVKTNTYPALVAEGGPAADDVSQGSPGVYAIGGNGGGAFGPGGPGVLAVGGAGADFNDAIVAIPGAVGFSYAGNFEGNVTVKGTLYADTKDFKIDHPLDPSSKYLVHASVESSEMMNIYTGNTALDGNGAATVELPDWFEALNKDFRYQLTAVGRPGPGLYIAQKISGGRFAIAGGAPGGEVSWQVTGVRHDAYAKANPLVVEEKKNARESGYYIHPEFYGAPAEKQIEWGRHPEVMKQLNALREKQLSDQKKKGL